LSFAHGTTGGTLSIFTVAGHFVRSVALTSEPQEWDLRSEAGEVIASGVYIYLVTDAQGTFDRGLFTVIR
jgi:hypothetical protein